MHRTILAVMLFVALIAPSAAATTLQNLQLAYGGESNASARYAVFAEKAQEEGYPSVASLFRAAAKAEEIHANNHAVMIKKLGAVPSTTIEKTVAKSTAENLETAIKGEVYERDVMYPEFLRVARDEGAESGVLRTFNYAHAAEAEHAKLYTEARKNLASLKNALETYYVCTVCGYTTTRLDFEKCPACANPKDKYIAVS
ncbi:MAG TPA: rubrerythrin family protein [Thermoanaerobaculia bacterium]|nr:rubrerythrin family protein [Thermoanaerobaculia bacterium]